MTGVVQSGSVTPGHLAAWTTDGVLQDAGLGIVNTYGLLAYTKRAVNFNTANTDYTLLVPLPAGYTRYRISQILIGNASASLAVATCGVFTAPAGGGTVIVTSGTSVSVSQSATDTINNMQSLTIQNQNTMALSDGVLYFRVQNAQGSAATADVSLIIMPLP